ncbi:hypothetical protein E4U15_002122 [Claviceps sp. LM218 group G6]|nr:hypothetical protein E4U15_002122 [Claviceps sp. LM218 group G6]
MADVGKGVVLESIFVNDEENLSRIEVEDVKAGVKEAKFRQNAQRDVDVSHPSKQGLSAQQ